MRLESWLGQRVDRRTAIKDAVGGIAGVAAATLIGCEQTSKDSDSRTIRHVRLSERDLLDREKTNADPFRMVIDDIFPRVRMHDKLAGFFSLQNGENDIFIRGIKPVGAETDRSLDWHALSINFFDSEGHIDYGYVWNAGKDRFGRSRKDQALEVLERTPENLRELDILRETILDTFNQMAKNRAKLSVIAYDYPPAVRSTPN